MKTILITGTAKTTSVKISNLTTSFKVQYDMNIWAANDTEQIQLITYFDKLLCGYGDLITEAKNIAAKYFNDELFKDGAYTTYLEHLILI